MSMSGGQGRRTFEIRTYGCQMNMHDSERLAGLLEAAGYLKVTGGAEPDVVVFNTCAVRENADNRLYGNLGHLLPVKNSHPGMQIAVGGCLAQKDRSVITDRAPWVDVVFGTHNIGSLPALLERARVQRRAQVEFAESLEQFPSMLPARRESPYSAWVAISVGCNNTCTFCIVPSLRGREEDRRPGDVLAEIQALVDDGVLEVTLLGQNVNSYGVAFGDRLAFGKLLRACGQIDGLERVRFTSPHPRDFTDDVIAAMAETPNVMPQLHMPLQSGSNAVLKAMRRAYRKDSYLTIIDKVRAAMPDAAITTDIIVGFPGETEQDFADTLDVAGRARFAAAFTFQYSIRPGTPAATMPDQVPPAVVAERYERLVALVDSVALAENQALVGQEVEVLVADGEGRKDDVTHRMSGRARDNRLVHFTPDSDLALPRPGDFVTTRVTQAAPHYLLADGPTLSVRPTRGGDAWQERQQAGESQEDPGGPVLIGMPAIRR
ncbi:MAG TPA: tRNA (N6-isopentenyl adenosine(37)-C2)-methylthiotransferase MiaB [Streptosporangiaceae bacterium]|nr:tRNA (N6-isopentenyl adenosine(37)-C2)-methylthiotransferase MiaB [Streptosporangiaceae bacterium]